MFPRRRGSVFELFSAIAPGQVADDRTRATPLGL
jgi:hypothetical protein